VFNLLPKTFSYGEHKPYPEERPVVRCINMTSVSFFPAMFDTYDSLIASKYNIERRAELMQLVVLHYFISHVIV